LPDGTAKMKIALITDAWQPQVNGVVTTLIELVRELEALGHRIEVIHPGLFKTRPCPGYAGIDLAVSPKRGLTEKLDAFAPEAIHIATEGPLGWAAQLLPQAQPGVYYYVPHKISRDFASSVKNPTVMGLRAFQVFSQTIIWRNGAHAGRIAYAGEAWF